MAEKIIKGIVVERFNFRDFDLIVKLVTNFGILKMVALGVRRPTSKNIYILNPGCLGEFEIFLAKNPNKLSKLKKGECLVRLDLTNENIYKFWKVIYQFSDENNYDSELFNIFQSAFSKINDKNVDAIIVYVIINWIKINGWISNLTSCKVCKTNKRLVNFDFYGGMECIYHRTLKPFFRFNVKELEILYWANFSLDEYLRKINFDHVYSIFEILKMFLKKNSYIIF